MFGFIATMPAGCGKDKNNDGRRDMYCDLDALTTCRDNHQDALQQCFSHWGETDLDPGLRVCLCDTYAKFIQCYADHSCCELDFMNGTLPIANAAMAAIGCNPSRCTNRRLGWISNQNETDHNA